MNECQGTGKPIYVNATTAWRGIRASKKRYKQCTAYPCPACHQWHITMRGRHDYPADWPRRRLALIERETRV